MVGITKFFLVIKKINIQNKSTNTLRIKSESPNAPEGNIIILPSKAAKVE